MAYMKKIYPILCFVLLVSIIFSTTSESLYAAKSKKEKRDDAYVMTSLELQSELMSYADRCVNNLSQMNYDFVNRIKDPKVRIEVFGDLFSFTLAAFTIAAQPIPEVALLDMMVLASLGRMVYEQHWLPKQGGLFKGIVQGYRRLEDDIWQIGAKLLSKEQQNELHDLMEEWRRDHPKQTTFAYMRFGEFAAGRQMQSLIKDDKKSGLFKSVQEASDEVEKLRMLAERGMYLGTRLPFITGGYANHSLSRLILNPELQKVLADVHNFSNVAKLLTKETEKLPEKLAEQRDQTINQVMREMAKLRRETIEQVMKQLTVFRDVTLDKAVEKVAIMREETIEHLMGRFSAEREKAFKDLLSEDERIKGLLTELRQTLTEGNSVLQSFNEISNKFGTDTPPDYSEPSDIKDYKETLAVAKDTVQELNTLVKSANLLLTSPGWEKLLPKLTETLNVVEQESEEVVDHTFRKAILLVLIWLVGYVIARLMYQFLSRRLFESNTQKA